MNKPMTQVQEAFCTYIASKLHVMSWNLNTKLTSLSDLPVCTYNFSLLQLKCNSYKYDTKCMVDSLTTLLQRAVAEDYLILYDVSIVSVRHWLFWRREVLMVIFAKVTGVQV